jgi:NitT/TauT family transport system ATP-binding protein
MLLLKNLKHQYGNFTVLEGINLRVSSGEIICLSGPSGCGKTTLLRIIAGSIKPTSGQVKNLFARTSFCFQEPRLLPWRNTLENIALGLKAKGIPIRKRQQIAIALARELGLDFPPQSGENPQEKIGSAANKYPHQLSGGMQQRVALGRALAIEPDLLLLDEPFSALDIGRRRQLQQLLLRLLGARDLAVILVTHDLAEAVLLADKLIVFSPPPSQIVYEWEPDKPPKKRDEAYIYQTVSKLLAIPEVALCFGLENSPVTS